MPIFDLKVWLCCTRMLNRWRVPITWRLRNSYVVNELPIFSPVRQCEKAFFGHSSYRNQWTYQNEILYNLLLASGHQLCQQMLKLVHRTKPTGSRNKQFSRHHIVTLFLEFSHRPGTGQPIWAPNMLKRRGIWRKNVPFASGNAIKLRLAFINFRNPQLLASYGNFKPNKRNRNNVLIETIIS